jgi:hypothetical protein
MDLHEINLSLLASNNTVRSDIPLAFNIIPIRIYLDQRDGDSKGT